MDSVPLRGIGQEDGLISPRLSLPDFPALPNTSVARWAIPPALGFIHTEALRALMQTTKPISAIDVATVNGTAN